MKKRMAGILLGILFSTVWITGCGKSKATETASESADIEKGEDDEAVPEEDEQQTEEETEEEPVQEVGIFLPSDSRDSRWSVDGQELEESLEAAGYQTKLYWAGDDEERQISQLEEALEEEVAALVVAPVDPYGLVQVVEQAKNLEIPVFSYDSLIMNTDGVSYYTAFGARDMGHVIGEAIVEKQELDQVQKEQQTRTIEFFMGEPQDNEELFFFNGVMEILAPYFESGALSCPSGKQTFDETAMVRDSMESVQAELAARLEEFYEEGEAPDIICTASDSFAAACIGLLEENGVPADGSWPFVTGLGSQAEAVKRVAEGKQGCTVFGDNRILAEKCAEMVAAELSGEDPELNDYEQYDNGKKIIGAYLCDMQLIDADNYQMLIDNGYYTAEQVEPDMAPAEGLEETETLEPETAEKSEGKI